MSPKEKQPTPKPFDWWLLTNWGIPWSVAHTRSEAIKYAEKLTGKPWKQCRKYCAVQKAKVTPL